MPLLVSLFFFVLFNNLFGIVPILSFAPFSKFSFAVGLAALVWIIYNVVGIMDKGFIGYLKHSTVPSGVPGWILPLLIPLEFLSNIIIRPATLSLRLFANMFAGHLLLILFSTGGAYLLIHATGSIVLKPAGVLAFVMGIAGRVPRGGRGGAAGLRVHAAHRAVHLRRARPRTLTATTDSPDLPAQPAQLTISVTVTDNERNDQ